MKKLFTLFTALLVVCVAYATNRYPDPTVSNSLRSATLEAASGDVIYLDEGTYDGTGDYTYIKGGKNLTIRAINGKSPVVKLTCPLRILETSSVKFIGIKFDGSSLGSYDSFFYAADATNNSMEFEVCEFTNMGKNIFQVASGKKLSNLTIKDCNLHDNSNRGIISQGTIGTIDIKGTTFTDFTGAGYSPIENYGSGTIGTLKLDDCEFSYCAGVVIEGHSGTHMDFCNINNCYFHNNSKNIIIFEKSSVESQETCDKLFFKNSTIANSATLTDFSSIIDLRAYNDLTTNTIKVEVDHCTFYNNPTINTDHSAIRPYLISDVTITNCIYAHPESYDRRATSCYGGSISNCLTYNLTHDSGQNGHRQSGGVPTLTGNFTADPLFTDAANGDFSYAGNWATGSVSPARGAGTDGSDLGDPRWHTEEVLPETDFSTPYILSNLSPKISGSIGYDGEGKEIIYNGAQNAGTATWKVHATRACCVSASFHNGLASTHHLSIEIRDKENNVVGSPLEDINRYSVGDYAISGSLCFPEAGDYTIILSNTYSYTGAHISNLALTLVSEEVTIGSTGWATYCSDNVLNFFGSDVEAYIVTGHSDNMLEKTRLNSTIPANTPLLLKADAGSYNIPMVSSSETSTTGNKLVRGTGSGVRYEEGKTRYVLMANGSTAEFQLLANGGASATVGTNKAYLEFNEVISLAPSALRLENEENNATSIEEVNSSDDAFKFIENGKLFIKKNGVVYDMMGRVIR